MTCHLCHDTLLGRVDGTRCGCTLPTIETYLHLPPSTLAELAKSVREFKRRGEG